jgi:2-polyprenyl-3-methyl-5-hydroxy-6-metoxy-1,4-benzoquinol methylase
MSMPAVFDVTQLHHSTDTKPCPNCEAGSLSPFYEVRSVPVHSVVSIRTRDAALAFPKGDIVLGICEGCAFVSNMAYDPSLQSYCPDCEETQGYSATFQVFHNQLAARLIKRYVLFGKKIVEVGCGKGEFLSLLCEMGGNSGVGFDPAFVPERNPAKDLADVEFVQDFYGEKYAGVSADFICCKMTLEHIQKTREFVNIIRRSIGSRPTPVFFQVPDLTRLLADNAFWDVYYEHCSYFTAHSLAQLFQRAGFTVIDIRSEYDGLYLAIEAVPAENPADIPEDHSLTQWAVERSREFGAAVRQTIESWNQRLASLKAAGKSVVIWGSGSKGVAFLTALRDADAVSWVVDINPYRQGMFMPGTGHEVVAPEYLRVVQPDVVVIMNPIYLGEIGEQLQALGIQSELVGV